MSADPPRGPPPSEGAVPNAKAAPPIVRSMPLRSEWDRSVPLPAGVSDGQREVGSGSSRTDEHDSEEGGVSGRKVGEATREEEREEEPEPCSVCQGPLPEEGRGLITCGHAFCFKCILRWSKNENTCPQCRRKFFSIIKTLTDKEHEELEKKLESAKPRDDSKSKKKRRKRKLPAFMSEIASKKTKTVRVRSRSQAQQFGRAQANAPHPQASSRIASVAFPVTWTVALSATRVVPSLHDTNIYINFPPLFFSPSLSLLAHRLQSFLGLSWYHRPL